MNETCVAVRRRRALRISAAGLIAACALSACGSTVRAGDGSTSGGTLASDDGGLGLSTPEPTAGSGSNDAESPAPTTSSGVTGPGDAGQSPAEAPVDSGSGGSTTGPTVTPTTGPVSTAPIPIGVYTVQGFSAFVSSIGGNASTGDMQAQAKAMIADINAHGGIGGRKITPVFHDYNVTAAASDVNSEYQAACSAWTQDAHVAAVINITGTVNDLLYECLRKAGVPTIASSELRDARFYSKYSSYFYAPGLPNTTRALSTLVDALKSSGFFGAKPKVGVIANDTDSDKASVEDGLKPALKRNGLPLTDYVNIANGTDATAAVRAAALRFKAQGIDRVLFSSYAPVGIFISAANNNGYHPKYGVTSYNGGTLSLPTLTPASEFSAISGIGWNVFTDVDAAHDPGATPAQKDCYKAMAAGGQVPGSRYEAYSMTDYCDTFRVLQRAIGKGVPFGISALQSGVEALTSFPAATTFRSGFGPGRHDGMRSYRLVQGSSSCKCFTYSGPLAAID